MIVTLSPAKLLDFKSPVNTDRSTHPLFPNETEELISELKHFSAEEITKLMSINAKQGLDVYQYIQAFDIHRTPQRQAAFAYNGIAYKGLDPDTFTDKDWDFAQKHLVMISGLYGVLRPLDLIKPYRLEMVIKLANSRGKTLYDFWSKMITEYFSERLMADDKVWVNVTSNEYSKAINRKLLPEGTKIITTVFKQETAQGPKMKVVYAKKARGMMARFIIKNRLTNPEDIKYFDTEGYAYAPMLSNNEEWVFTR